MDDKQIEEVKKYLEEQKKRLDSSKCEMVSLSLTGLLEKAAAILLVEERWGKEKSGSKTPVAGGKQREV